MDYNGEISGHPWILFYTERTLKMLPIKLKLKNQESCQQSSIAAKIKSDRNRIDSAANVTSLNEVSDLSSSESCNADGDDVDDCFLVDALATAISHVRISEPKRSRLCVPTGPIEQHSSSNMKANNLCKAF